MSSKSQTYVASAYVASEQQAARRVLLVSADQIHLNAYERTACSRYLVDF